MTRTSFLLLAFLAAAALVTSGCGSTSPTTAPGELPIGFPDHSAEDIRAQILQRSDTLHSFTATARITVRSPEQNQSFNAEVRQQRADSLFMRFSLFGVEGGRLLVTPDSVFFYDSRQNTLQVGPVSAAQEILPAPVTSGQIFENMLGLVRPNPSTDWSVEADSSLYYLTSSSGRRTMTVDPSRWRVVRFEKESEDGTTLEERLFSEFRSVGGILIPHQIRFRRPDDGLTALINYKEITLNPEQLSLTLDVPDQIPRKPLR